MKRTYFHVLMVALLSLTFTTGAIPVPRDGDPITYEFNFDQNVKPWEPFAHKLPVNEHTLVVKEEQLGNIGFNRYAALTTQNADATWMMASFESSGFDVVNVRLEFQARNFEGTKGVQPIVYIGTTKPTSVDDFAMIGMPLTKQWQNYKLVKAVKGEIIVIAIGYTSGEANWGGIDNATIRVSPW